MGSHCAHGQDHCRQSGNCPIDHFGSLDILGILYGKPPIIFINASKKPHFCLRIRDVCRIYTTITPITLLNPLFPESTARITIYAFAFAPPLPASPTPLPCIFHILHGSRPASRPVPGLTFSHAPSSRASLRSATYLRGPGQPLGRFPASPSPCRQNENGARRPRFLVPTRLRSERVLHAQRVVVDVAGVIGINIHETRVSQRALAEVVDTHNFHRLVLVSCDLVVSRRRNSDRVVSGACLRLP